MSKDSMEHFELRHENGKLFAIVTINGVTCEKDVTEYFSKSNAHDDWLDFGIGPHNLKLKG